MLRQGHKIWKNPVLTFRTALICSGVTRLADLRMYVGAMNPEKGLKLL